MLNKTFICNTVTFIIYTSVVFLLPFIFSKNFQFLLFCGVFFWLLALFIHGAILFFYERNNMIWRMLMLKRLQDHMQKQLAEMQAKIMVMHEAIADSQIFTNVNQKSSFLQGDEEKIMDICNINLWRLEDGNLDVILQKSLEENNLQIYIQPIVTLPQRRRCFFECYSWITTDDGKIVLPRFYEPVARDLGLLTQINHSLLQKSLILLQQLHQHDSTLAFSCNIHPLTFKYPQFWNEFVLQFSKTPSLFGKLMIELNGKDFMEYSDFLVDLIQEAKKVGLFFALDHAEEDMLTQGFSFIKCTAESILRLNRWPVWNIPVIATKIEREEILLELLDLNIAYGQGFLFGEPRLSKLQPLENI